MSSAADFLAAATVNCASRSADDRASVALALASEMIWSALRCAEATSSSARAWALARMVDDSASLWDRSSAASRRASATMVAASEELRSDRWAALARVRARSASASALALESTEVLCSSALRSSCSMREPSPA